MSQTQDLNHLSLKMDKLQWKIPFCKKSSGYLSSFSREAIKNTVSNTHGLDVKNERKRRIKSVDFIINLGQELNLPFATISVAIYYFHKFFFKNSMMIHHEKVIVLHLFRFL